MSQTPLLTTLIKGGTDPVTFWDQIGGTPPNFPVRPPMTGGKFGFELIRRKCSPTGNDTTGNGTDALPYLTPQRAALDCPALLQGRTFRIDMTGYGTYAAPVDGFIMPTTIGGNQQGVVLDSAAPEVVAFGGTFNRSDFEFYATPTTLLTVAANTYTVGSVATAALHSTFTVTGATWTVDQWKGNIFNCPGNYLLARVITNTSDTITIANAALPGYTIATNVPFTIAQESCTVDCTASRFFFGRWILTQTPKTLTMSVSGFAFTNASTIDYSSASLMIARACKGWSLYSHADEYQIYACDLVNTGVLANCTKGVSVYNSTFTSLYSFSNDHGPLLVKGCYGTASDGIGTGLYHEINLESQIPRYVAVFFTTHRDTAGGGLRIVGVDGQIVVGFCDFTNCTYGGIRVQHGPRVAVIGPISGTGNGAGGVVIDYECTLAFPPYYVNPGFNTIIPWTTSNITITGAGGDLVLNRTPYPWQKLITRKRLGDTLGGAARAFMGDEGSSIPFVKETLFYPTAIITAATTLTDYTVARVDPTAGAFALTLPDASLASIITVKNISVSTNAITVNAAAGQTIDGAAACILTTARAVATFSSDGVTGWMVTTSLAGAGGGLPGGSNGQVLGYSAGAPTYIAPSALLATGSAAGFMSAPDKLERDTYGAYRVLANVMSGSDIGAKINAACAQLAGPGEVYVADGNYTITTKIRLTPGIRLKLGAGTFTNNFNGVNLSPIFTLQDDCSIEGSGFGTIIHEAILTASNGVVLTIADLKSFGPSADLNALGNVRMTLRNFQMRDNPATAPTIGTGVGGAIMFGNIRDVLVENLYLNGTRGYGVCQASYGTSGNCAVGFRVQDCIFDNIPSQNLVVTNCAQFKFINNQFRRTFDAITFIDCEMNDPTDTVKSFIISGNVFVPRDNTPRVQFGVCLISVSGAWNPAGELDTGTCYSGVISHNIVESGTFTDTMSFGTVGISLDRCREVLVSDNVLRYVSNEPIALRQCHSCIVKDNQLTSCGSGGHTGSIRLISSVSCWIDGNMIAEAHGGGFGAHSQPLIIELSAGSGFQDSDYNTVTNNRVIMWPSATASGPAGQDAQIILTGANSRAYSNMVGSVGASVMMDFPGLLNVAELRMANPGSRNAAAPTTAFLMGSTTPGDGGAGLYWFDQTSTATDDGFMVIAPTWYGANGSTVGNWRRGKSALTITTTQRSALVLTSSDAGMVIWNSTTAQLEVYSGTAWAAAGGSGTGTGTVTSVALTAPSFLTVLGTPVTTSGTLALTLATQTANTVFRGPTTGAAAAPTFGALVAADLPTSGVTAGSYTLSNITVDVAGRITAASNGSGGGGSGTTWPLTNGTSSNTYTSAIANGATAVAHVFDSTNALSTAGGKLASFRTSTTEKLFIGGDGAIGSSSSISLSPSGNAGAVRVSFDGGNNFGAVGGAGSLSAIGFAAAYLYFLPAGLGSSNGWFMGTGIFSSVGDLVATFGAPGRRAMEVWSRVHAGVEQAMSGAGVILMDSSLGEMLIVTPSGNVTELRLNVGMPAQVITIELVHFSTITWPTTITNARLVGGTFLKTRTAGAIDTFTFRYNVAAAKWDEISRSLNLS